MYDEYVYYILLCAYIMYTIYCIYDGSSSSTVPIRPVESMKALLLMGTIQYMSILYFYSVYHCFSILFLLSLLCMYGWGYTCYWFLFYCSVYVSNILTQWLVFMYLIGSYCCYTAWVDCADMGVLLRSSWDSSTTTTAWS